MLKSRADVAVQPGDDGLREAVLEGEPCVLDLRGMDSGAELWFSQTTSRVKERLCLDISRDVFPITSGVAATTGGAPSDEFGRVTFEGFTPEGFPGKMWFTGLYAAGRSAHSGMHGDGMLAGNLLLEDLVSGKEAGTHAAIWAQENQFGGSSNISESENSASAHIASLNPPMAGPSGRLLLG